ncbi:UNVERIFIED_CONTAM: Trehalose-6-P synthase/phosphatase complex synthase subunit, partial [Siphonaria sp. JEL0065]
MVSNRLPITITPTAPPTSPLPPLERYQFKASSGGLVSGINGLDRTSFQMIWFGWLGGLIPVNDRSAFENYLYIIRTLLFLCIWSRGPLTCITMASPTTKLLGILAKNAFNHWPNRILWPLFHYQPGDISYDELCWEAYKQANSDFADVLAEFIEDGDLVWIHDYHLMLLPALLRSRLDPTRFPNIKIVFVLHIPFPSSEGVSPSVPHNDQLGPTITLERLSLQQSPELSVQDTRSRARAGRGGPNTSAPQQLRVAKRAGQGWPALVDSIDGTWRDTIRPLFEHYMERTPGSWIEEKEVNITWHCMNSDPDFGSWQAAELQVNLERMLSHLAVSIVLGDKTLELRPSLRKVLLLLLPKEEAAPHDLWRCCSTCDYWLGRSRFLHVPKVCVNEVLNSELELSSNRMPTSSIWNVEQIDFAITYPTPDKNINQMRIQGTFKMD